MFCYNIIENFLKARNLRFVSLSGLSFLTLVYIFSGRSVQTCKLVAATGAKGNHNIVTQFLLPNSTESSYKSSVDGVTLLLKYSKNLKNLALWITSRQEPSKSGNKHSPLLSRWTPQFWHSVYPQVLSNVWS